MAGAFDEDELEELDNDETFNQARASRLASSKVYFQQAAKRNISWFNPEEKAWLRLNEEKNEWQGWSISPVERKKLDTEWDPWSQILDDNDPPFYRWFVGAHTNAAYNEVDVHVLEGHGRQWAYIEEADPTLNGDEGAQINRHDLLARSAAAAQVLKTEFGLVTGDRVLFNLPPGIDQILWVEACKRLGVIYCCCNPGLPPEQIADRVYILRAKLVVTAEHPEWSFIVHKALNDFVPVPEAMERGAEFSDFEPSVWDQKWASRLTVSLKEPPFEGTIQVNEGVMVGAKVLILGNLKVPMNALQQRMEKPPMKAVTITNNKLPLLDCDLHGHEYVAALWEAYGPPVPVEANFPLFIIFTSGTTGKPKGVSHVHAYPAGLVETMRVVFEADPAADRMLTVGALGWITGQSYQISAVLAARITAVIMRGNPVRPTRHRFAQVINKHKVTIFKAGSAFLREVMAVSEAMTMVKEENPMQNLRVATFCAEPVSCAVQEFAMDSVCRNYINSYWATEHGGIAWSRKYNDAKQVLKPDAHCWPMPWIDADVWNFDLSCSPKNPEQGGLWKATPADTGDKAEVVCIAPYPYMFRYVWGDLDNFGKPGWTGDREIMLKKYWRRTQLSGNDEVWAYVQGDFAVKYHDGSYTFHGRSDEVLNVNGILFGTEHIEGAILRDKQLNPDSKVGHCVVTGFPDDVAGEVPLAWIVPGDPNRDLGNEDYMRLFGLVNETVGKVQVKFITVPSLPQTFSGKFMRRLLKSISKNEPLGDVSTIANLDCIEPIKESYVKWAAVQSK